MISCARSLAIAALSLCVLLSGNAAAAGMEAVLSLPGPSVEAGQPLVFSVYVHNPGETAVELAAPQSLACRLVREGAAMEAQALAVDPVQAAPAVIPPQGYARLSYSLVIPKDVLGPLSLEVTEFQAPPVLFSAAAPAPEAMEPPPDMETAATGEEEEPAAEASGEPPATEVSMDSLFAQYQPYLVNIAPYMPMYFLAGVNPEDSKFQFSFRYRFFNPENDFVEKHPWLSGLHFAYTQTSFWDLKSESMPFKDTSYKPEFFYLSSNIRKRLRWMDGFFLQTGFQHESNGRDGSFSRSTNFLYARPGFVVYHPKSRLGFMASTKVWTYINNEDETNPDLASHRGYFDLDVTMGQAHGLVLGTNLRWADKGGSVQVDLTYPLHELVWKQLNLCLQAQYVNSLAESLLYYNQRTEAFRLGFAIVR